MKEVSLDVWEASPWMKGSAQQKYEVSTEQMETGAGDSRVQKRRLLPLHQRELLKKSGKAQPFVTYAVDYYVNGHFPLRDSGCGAFYFRQESCIQLLQPQAPKCVGLRAARDFTSSGNQLKRGFIRSAGLEPRQRTRNLLRCSQRITCHPESSFIMRAVSEQKYLTK